jgi:DNA invertase Pin-like site-specific DNA recombinase
MNRAAVRCRSGKRVFQKPFDYLNTLGIVSAMSAKVSDKPPVPVAILLRVSTDRQETARQRNELRAVAESKGWAVVEVCEETITGRAGIEERAGLKRAEELAAAGTIKKVLVHEISRLSRRPSVAHTFTEMLEGYGVSLYWHAQGIETLLPSGKRNPSAAIMLAVLAEMARAETDTLRERINSGLAEARRKGVTLGRPKGTRLEPDAFMAKHRDLAKLLRAGQSIRNAAKIAGKGVSTVQRVKAALDGAA